MTLVWGLWPDRKDHVTRPLRSETRVRILVASLQLYAESNQNTYPPADEWVSLLSSNGYIAEDEAFSPRQNGKEEPYTFLPARYDQDKSRVIVYGKPNRGEQGVMVGFANHHVELLSHDEFERLLTEQTSNRVP